MQRIVKKILKDQADKKPELIGNIFSPVRNSKDQIRWMRSDPKAPFTMKKWTMTLKSCKEESDLEKYITIIFRTLPAMKI